jgi:hypothetical protein
MYGGPPATRTWPDPDAWPGMLPMPMPTYPYPEVVTGTSDVKVKMEIISTPKAEPKKLRVSVVARDGKIKLLLTLDGAFLSEVEVEGTSVAVEETLDL